MQRRAVPQRSGTTLVELMIAMIITLILILAVVKIIQAVGDVVRQGRAVIEMSGKIRSVSHQLRTDLTHVTAPMRPWPNAGSGLGYFEYLEGPTKDIDVFLAATPNPDFSMRGDIDDVLMFTARSRGEPFVGQFDSNNDGTPDTIIESQLAEIVWWTVLSKDIDGDGAWDPGDELTLYRRVLLIRPDLNDAVTGVLVTGVTPQAHYNVSDISVHVDAGKLVANSLSDLTDRENRFAHFFGANSFPHAIATDLLRTPFDSTLPVAQQGFVQSGDSLGLDVIAGHLLGFDVKVYDPKAPIFNDDDLDHSLLPGDIGWNDARVAALTDSTRLIGHGAYVDLRYSSVLSPASVFSGPGEARSQLNHKPKTDHFTYDTWSWHYENDGVDQDNVSPFNDTNGADQGVNGLDDNNANGVDDVGERETSPPYPVALRGLEVRIRMVEQDSQQIRQTTILTNFMPE